METGQNVRMTSTLRTEQGLWRPRLRYCTMLLSLDAMGHSKSPSRLHLLMGEAVKSVTTSTIHLDYLAESSLASSSLPLSL